jgi:hypothetical protein
MSGRAPTRDTQPVRWELPLGWELKSEIFPPSIHIFTLSYFCSAIASVALTRVGRRPANSDTPSSSTSPLPWQSRAPAGRVEDPAVGLLTHQALQAYRCVSTAKILFCSNRRVTVHYGRWVWGHHGRWVWIKTHCRWWVQTHSGWWVSFQTHCAGGGSSSSPRPLARTSAT